MTDTSGSARSLSDAAISRREQDRFRRGQIASRVAAEARITAFEGGNVIAICGPWGSGKTSIANIAMEELKADPTCVVMHFNPWAFFGTEDLILRFFVELSATLGKKNEKLKAVAKQVAGYAGALSGVAKFVPVGGSAGEAMLTTLQQLVGAAAGDALTLDEQRNRLVKALREYDGRIVVFLDDIDRLTDDEIRAVVRLVKVVGDLPRLSYVLSFDKARVEQALGAPESDPNRAQERGRAYLEKIVQSEHTVPKPRPNMLAEFVVDGLNLAIAEYEGPEAEEAEWMVALDAIAGRVRTPREAKRLANAVAAGTYLYGNGIALVDVVMLESLRVQEPEVHERLLDMAATLCFGIPADAGPDAAIRVRERLEDLLQHAALRDPTERLLGQLFPAVASLLPGGRERTASERRDRRVADPSVFSLYVHAALSDDEIAADLVEQLVACLDRPDEFGELLVSVGDEAFGNAVVRLLDYREQFHDIPGTELAAHILRSASWRLHPAVAIEGTPVFTLIDGLIMAETGPPGGRIMTLFEIAPSMSARLAILRRHGNEEDDDVFFGSHERQSCFSSLAKEVRDASATALTEEPAAFQLLQFAAGRFDDVAPLSDKLDDDGLLVRLLDDAQRTPSGVKKGDGGLFLRVGELCELFGTTQVRRRIEELAAPESPGTLAPEDAAVVRQALERFGDRTAPGADR